MTPPTPLPQYIFFYILNLVFTSFLAGVDGYPKPTPTYPKINQSKMLLFHLVPISKLPRVQLIHLELF